MRINNYLEMKSIAPLSSDSITVLCSLSYLASKQQACASILISPEMESDTTSVCMSNQASRRKMMINIKKIHRLSSATSPLSTRNLLPRVF